jgi:Na+-driven multidrug efflux pump
VAAGALRGAGNTRFPLVMTFLQIWGTVILALITTQLFHAGLEVVWAGFIISSPLNAYFLWRRFRRGDWKDNTRDLNRISESDAVLEAR